MIVAMSSKGKYYHYDIDYTVYLRFLMDNYNNIEQFIVDFENSYISDIARKYGVDEDKVKATLYAMLTDNNGYVIKDG